MKRLFTLAVALLLTTATFAQATDPTTDPTALTNAFFKAMQDEDGNTMAKLLTDDFQIISFDGQSADKDLIGQALSGGYLTVDAATVQDARARQYNNDAAVVSGSLKFKGALQGQNFDKQVSYSIVAVKQGTGWKVALAQLSPAQ